MGYDHHLAHSPFADETTHIVVGEGRGLHHLAPGACGDLYLAANLAVDLNHVLDLVLAQGVLVRLGPAPSQDVLAHGELPPEMVRDMGGDRCEQAQDDAQPLAHHGPALRGFIQSHQGVDHSHAGGDHCVELMTLVIVESLLQGSMDLATCCLLGLVEVRRQTNLRRLDCTLGQIPHPFQEACSPLHPIVVPLQGLVRG